MNERIQALAEQAGFLNKDEESIGYFAELIVLECASLAKSKSERIEEIKAEDHDDHIRLQSLAWQFEEFGYEIKKHFGVKE